MEDQLGNMNDTPTVTPSRRRPSFVVLCQQEKGRSATDSERLPIAVKASVSSGGCTPKMLSVRQAVDSNAALAERESGSLGTERDHSAIAATGSSGVLDEVVALQEMILTQKYDLETAASIGQRLLDATDELSAKLEAAREEKWLVECENEALRRDLEHATQRCEQMERERPIEIVPGEETQIEEFDLWSPANAVTSAARVSASTGDWTSSTPPFAGAINDDTGEEKHQADEHLKDKIKTLEQANSALEEKLIEARLETVALRRATVERREAVLDTETSEVEDEDQQGLCSTWSAPDVCGKLRESEGDEAGMCQDDGEGVPGMVSGDTDTQEPAAPVVSEAYHGNDSQKKQVGHERVENPNAIVLHRAEDDVGRTAGIPEVGPPPARVVRRQSSSAFKDAEEQRELIEALRGQVSQLQLEKQMRMTHTAVAKTDSTEGSKLATGRKLGSYSQSSSDDDSGHGRDDREDTLFGEIQLCSQYPKRISGVAFSEDDASYPRKKNDGDIDNGGNSDAAHILLQARLNELSAELEAVNKEIEALREQAQLNQAENLELQREILRLQSLKDKSSLMAAAVAAHSTYHDRGGGGESLEQRSDCLRSGWLHRLWFTVFGGDEGSRSRSEDNPHDGTPIGVGGEFGHRVDISGNYRNGRGSGFSVCDRELLLNRDTQAMARK